MRIHTKTSGAIRLALLAFSASNIFLFTGCNRETPVSPVPQAQEGEQTEQAILQELRQIESDVHNRLAKPGNIVELPAGSEDGLAAAIAAAGPGGVVLVKSGLHRESGTVTITHAVGIVGEAGAILEVDTQPLPPASAIDPALHILNARAALIWGLEIRPKQSIGGAAILAENSLHVVIANNSIYDHQFSVMLEQADRAVIWRNTVSATTAWQVSFFEVHGIVVINGDDARIVENNVSNAFFGVWACDRDGVALRNTMQANFVGLILCNVPQQAFPLPGGNLAGSETSATGWLVRGNQARGNFDAGYLVIDNANRNLLAHNDASGNGTYDIELTGDSFRFGFLTPKSFENKVVAGRFQNLKIKDCGENNTVIGGQLVDNSQDPCN